MKMKKIHVLLVSLAMVLLFSVGGTIAFLIASTDPLENEFAGSNVACEVKEADGAYQVKNTGDIHAYIRVAIVATWQDADGNIYYQAPKVQIAGPEAFAKHGDYYYCTSPVVPEGTVGSIHVTQAEGETAPAGYTLKVEVLAQAIQADGQDKDGKKPVTLAWGVEVNADGTLNINP